MLVALAGTAAVLAVQIESNRELKAANTELYSANARVTESNTNLAAASVRERERFELAGVAAMPAPGYRPPTGGRKTDRAMTWLRKAVDGGYRPNGKALASPTFNRLRSRADFQDLVFPKDPFAR